MDTVGIIKHKITFPNADSEDDNFTFLPEDDLKLNLKKRPVVIVLGWAGCTERHLSKYSAIYEQRRFITVQYTAPTDILFFSGNAAKLKIIAQKLLDILFEHNLEDHPLFFHIMSNGGGFVYNNLTAWIHSSSKYSRLQVYGCIYDSCPGKRRILKAVKAFMASLRVNTFLRYLFGFGLLLIMTAAKIITSLFPYFSNMKKPFVLYEDLVQDNARCPQLLLYSSNDDVVLQCDIVEFISQRLKLGIKVWSMCWEDSKHVAHLLSHREAYINKCNSFVNYCLQQTPSQSS
ncbi:transmembrane protein 53-like [Gigantopelta aegis]|uniref:transmembrane protein 53-like n=1 Tax=Gigantopelta aegis TaxID=1735272 RepID=UPI001B887613|nr:transmembrane protein 53-like [Gigantopelta aegis]